MKGETDMNVGQYHYLHGSCKVVLSPSPKLWMCMEQKGKLRMFSAGTNRNRALKLNLITGESDSYDLIDILRD